jgi:cell division protein ZapA
MTAEGNGKRSDEDRETTVRVTILGQEYPVRAHADADYIREIAASLDARMRKIQQAEPDRPPLKVAVLAALNLIDEVFSLRREKVDLVDRYERKVREITEHLGRGLREL